MNKVLIIVGPSGSGKTTLTERLIEMSDCDIVFNRIVSDATRPMRSGEVDGVDYYFIDEDTFLNKKANDEYVETTYYAGSYKGMSKEEFRKKQTLGIPVVAMDINGLAEVTNAIGKENVMSVFLDVTPENLKKRMIKRGDKEEDIEKRMDNYYACKEGENGYLCEKTVDNNGTIDEMVKATLEYVVKSL